MERLMDLFSMECKPRSTLYVNGINKKESVKKNHSVLFRFQKIYELYITWPCITGITNFILIWLEYNSCQSHYFSVSQCDKWYKQG